MRGVIATLLSAAVFALAMIWIMQRRMIYLPYREVAPPAAAGLHQVDEVTFTTEDGLSLHGWFVPANAAPQGFTVLVFNGNAGNRSMRATLASALADHGIATFLFDYRGFGENRGSPSETGLVRDARAARAYIAGRPDVDSSRIVYFGESLGGAVAVLLATEVPPAALILRSPFTSLTDIGRHHYPILPVRLLLRDRYPSIDLIGRISVPLMVIAGDRDTVIPTEQSRRLYAAARDPKRLLIIEDTDHNDDELFSGRRLIQGVVEFLAAVER